MVTGVVFMTLPLERGVNRGFTGSIYGGTPYADYEAFRLSRSSPPGVVVL